MEPRFKVGDPVTVVDRPDEHEGYYGLQDGIQEYVGRTFTIMEDQGGNIRTYGLDGDAERFFWPEYLLEPVSQG